MANCFNRAGEPIALDEWAESSKGDFDTKRRVDQTTLPNGRWVSTVWLGLDHSFGSGPPLIFETMVFPSHEDMGELDCDRYSSEAEAREGHQRMCAKWSVDTPTED